MNRQWQSSPTAAGFLANLLNAANVASSDGFNIDRLLPDSYDYASIPTVYVPIATGGIRPNVNTLDVVGAPVAPDFTFSALSAIALPADDLLTPTGVFAFAEGVYDRTLLDPWRAKLLADLQNGGYFPR